MKNKSFDKRIKYACNNNHFDKFKELVCSDEANLENLNVALCYACSNGHLHMAKYILVESPNPLRPDVDTTDGYPLFWACLVNNLEMVEFLTTSPFLIKKASPFNSMINLEDSEISDEIINFLRKIQDIDKEQKKLSQHSEIKNTKINKKNMVL